jgi:hypothetical protein
MADFNVAVAVNRGVACFVVEESGQPRYYRTFTRPSRPYTIAHMRDYSVKYVIWRVVEGGDAQNFLNCSFRDDATWQGLTNQVIHVRNSVQKRLIRKAVAEVRAPDPEEFITSWVTPYLTTMADDDTLGLDDNILDEQGDVIDSHLVRELYRKRAVDLRNVTGGGFEN